MYALEKRVESRKKIEELAQPLVQSIRDAGFTFTYHCSESDFGAQYRLWGDANHPDLSLWHGRISCSMHINDEKIANVTVRGNYVRTVNFKNWESALKNTVLKLTESLRIAKKSYADADTEAQKRQEWDARREQDFKDWKVPAFLGDESDKNYRLFGLRRDPTLPQVGHYSLDFNSQGTFRNLTATQVKALCAFIQDHLPKLP